MKKVLFFVVAILLSVNWALASSIESEIKDFARREYPNDSRMQNHVYKKQMTAYNYLLTVRDNEIKEFAFREYPYNYVMQKHTYDKQLLAKRYMSSVSNLSAKITAEEEYPYNYVMQKYIFNKIVRYGFLEK